MSLAASSAFANTNQFECSGSTRTTNNGSVALKFFLQIENPGANGTVYFWNASGSAASMSDDLKTELSNSLNMVRIGTLSSYGAVPSNIPGQKKVVNKSTTELTPSTNAWKVVGPDSKGAMSAFDRAHASSVASVNLYLDAELLLSKAGNMSEFDINQEGRANTSTFSCAPVTP